MTTTYVVSVFKWTWTILTHFTEC